MQVKKKSGHNGNKENLQTQGKQRKPQAYLETEKLQA